MSWLVVAGAQAQDNGAPVQFTVNGGKPEIRDYKKDEITELVVSNSELALTFGKDVNGDFSGLSVKLHGKELAHNLHGVEPRDVDRHRTFYLDYGAGRGHLECDTVRVIKFTPEMAHFAVIDSHNAVKLDHHFVLMKDIAGVYDYVIIKTAGGGGGGEMRTMYRFDYDILDHAYMNERTGQQPKYAVLQTLPELGDETWRMPDGRSYQKYDYAGYFSENPMWGHFGHGFGAWFMPVSTESYAGGPLRQELIVHQDALILNYIGGGHFGGGGTAAGKNGEKLHGPWFLYFNQAQTTEELIADAKRVATLEQTKWPYKWMEEPLYPLNRTTVTGQLKIADGRSAAGAWVVLSQPGGDVYRHAGDYIFSTRADAEGKFSIPHVRANTYSLYAWATQGSVTDQLKVDGVEVKGDKLDLGTVTWTPTKRNHLLWQIGQSDRMSGEFKFGNELRSMDWMQKIPRDLTFTIGQSKAAEDWYFALPRGSAQGAAPRGGGGRGRGGARGGENAAAAPEGNAPAAAPQVAQAPEQPAQQPPAEGGNRRGRGAQGGGANVGAGSTWQIKFNVDKPYTGNAYFTLAVAGGGARANVSCNGVEIGTVSKGNDQSTYRAALRSGVYQKNEFIFPASSLKQGENIITIAGSDLMFDTLLLEAD